MKRKVLLLFALFIWVSGISQTKPYEPVHKDYFIALNLLQHSLKALPADSLIIKKEIKRVRAAYFGVSDSLRMHASADTYSHFAANRYINLAYLSGNAGQMELYFDSLFLLSAAYPQYIEQDKQMADNIAKVVVNGLETTQIVDEDSLIKTVIRLIKKHYSLQVSEGWTLSRKQDFVNRYAAQYYNSGIIAMAEHVFRAFRQLYTGDSISLKAFPFSKNYDLYNSELSASGRKLNDFNLWKIIINLRREQSMNLVYLIMQLRTIKKINPNLSVILVRNTEKISDAYLQAVRRNLSSAGYFVLNLDEKDTTDFKKAPQFGVITGDTLYYATNSPIDFLEWLESPFAKQKAEEKKKRKALRKEAAERKKQLAQMPQDTSLKHEMTSGNTTVRMKGYWPADVSLKIKRYRFTQSGYDFKPAEKEIASLEIYQAQKLIYSLNYIPVTTSDTIDLLSNRQHHVEVHFSNKVNNSLINKIQYMDSLVRSKSDYDQIIQSYPYPRGEFIQTIKRLSQTINKQILNAYKGSNTIEKAVISIRQGIAKLKEKVPPQKITRKEFTEIFPPSTFDSILWRSPYYKQFIDDWLMYGRNDIKPAIDLLYSSGQWIPDSGDYELGRYLWKKMNGYGREDMMLYIDSTYLLRYSCYNGDIKKRLEGYKRMAIGQKAPDIAWQENGKEMHLYDIKADTTLVIFWADWCPHCMRVLPALYKKYSRRPTVQVVAVNIDDDSSSQKLGEKLMPLWHHVRAPKKWDDPLVALYNVFGTPTIFFLDSEKHIIKR